MKKSSKKFIPLLVLLAGFIVLVGIAFYFQSISDKKMPFVKVVVSEYDYKENKTYYNSANGYSDWLELYNDSDTDVDLFKYTIYLDNKVAYTFEESKILKAHEYLILTDIDLDYETSQRLVFKDRKRRQLENIKISKNNNLFVKTPGFSNDERGIEQYLESLVSYNEKTLVINEYCASNTTGIAVNNNLYDWIEIKNVSNTDINLKGYGLTDEKGVYKWLFSDEVLKPNQIKLVYASLLDNENNTNFKLNKQSGSIDLFNSDGKVIDSSSYNDLQDDQVVYRDYNTLNFYTSYISTPGFENNKQGLEQYYQYIESQRDSDILIWEVISENGSYNYQSNGKCYGMVELKNVSDHDVNLKDYYLTDNNNDPFKNQLPDVILKPNQIYVMVASNGKLSGDNQLSFNINNEETVSLYRNGYFKDGLCAKHTYMNISIGRINGKDGFYYFKEPTLGSENNKQGYRDVAQEAVFTTKGGFYDAAKSVSIYIDTNKSIASDDNTIIYYTLDGSVPTTNSAIYNKNDGINVRQDTVVKTLVVQKGLINSHVASSSYFLSAKHSLDVISITMDPKDFDSDQRGIYAYGYSYSEKFPYSGANFNKRWEREANVQLYTHDGNGFNVDAGIMIFGAYSRGYDKKSFRLNFRTKYGTSSLNYDVFNTGETESFNKLVLRAGSQDEYRAMMRDELFTSLARDTTELLTQRYRPVALYINGNYWGLYYIREKINDEFVAKYRNVDPASVTVLFNNYTVNYGSNVEYIKLLEYVMNHDLRVEEYYNHVEQLVDIQNLVDYTFTCYFLTASDNGNVRYYNSSDPSYDGKWRWMLYDLDLTMVKFLGIDYFLGPHGRTTYTNTLIYNLLKNDKVKQLFIERASYHMHNTFEKSKVLSRIEEFEKTIDQEMKYDTVRWPKQDYNTWKNYRVPQLKGYVENRYSTVINEMKSYFNLTDQQVEQYFGDLK